MARVRPTAWGVIAGCVIAHAVMAWMAVTS